MERELVAAVVVLVAVAAAVLARRRPRAGTTQIDPVDFGLAGDGLRVVGFTSAYCLSCARWRAALDEHDVDATLVDAGARPDLARKYRVDVTPLVMLVEMPHGRVVESWYGDPEPEHIDRLTLTL